MKYDSRGATIEHINKVHYLVRDLTDKANLQSNQHDQSKLEPFEKEIFDKHTPELSKLTYGSKEYRDMLDKIKPALDHHYANNRHHPEYHKEKGIEGMTLMDIIEMICDWKAATERHDDGDIRKSLTINTKRFNISPSLVKILENTIEEMGW